MAKSDDKKANDTKPNDSKPAEPKLDAQALTAAIAGFLACQVLTCRFLVQEGVIDGEKFTAFLDSAMTEMATGVDDPRALFGLQQLINGLRSGAPAGERTQ
jgi:hypothetical protein